MPSPRPPRSLIPPASAVPIGPGGLCGWCAKPYTWTQGAWWCDTQACRVRQSMGAVSLKQGDRTHYVYVPTFLGMVFEESHAKNRLLGGAAMCAKSHILRWYLTKRAMRIPGYTALILRRTYGELEKSQLRRLSADVPMLGGEYIESKYLARFQSTGGLIEAGHLDDKSALSRWLSTEYDDIVADEGSTFDPHFLLELSTRARTSNPHVIKMGGARFSVGTNPGGPAWPILLDLFVTHQPDFELFPALKKVYDPLKWHYIKGLLDANPYRDADYEESLAVLGEQRYAQLRWGSEFVTDGQFFGELRQKKDDADYHERTLPIHSGVEWSCGMDWGFNAPGWIGFFAHLADGHYHLAKEYKFRGQTADQVATAFHDIVKAIGVERVRYVAGDPAMWHKTGAGKGESIGETLQRRGLPMRRGDNDRFNGAMRMHEILRDDGSGTPWLTVSPECRYWWRSMPALVQDPNDPDDVDTTKDDHPYDGTRYWAMSRPSPTRVVESTRVGGVGQLLAAAMRGTQPGVLGSSAMRSR